MPASETTALLSAGVERVAVRSRAASREFELVSLLWRAGLRVERLVVGPDGPLDGVTVGEARVRSRYDVAVLAVRSGGEWLVAPADDVELAGGGELYAVGPRESLAAFREAVGE